MDTQETGYVRFETEGVPIKAWVRGVELDPAAKRQLEQTAALPIVHGWIAAMPDVHYGLGATVGSVIPTRYAVIPAAVGVDIGCGMTAVRTTLAASRLPDDLRGVRAAIEAAVPHGRTHGGKRNDRGAWSDPPEAVRRAWEVLGPRFEALAGRHRALLRANHVNHLGTLGTGNHFIEVCLDEERRVWFMLHSGSRGVGNRIGSHFIELARDDMRRQGIDLPDRDLAYLREGSPNFADYVEGVEWAQEYAATNRALMMEAVVKAMRGVRGLPRFAADALVVDCHHNYVRREMYEGEEVYVTRKGAVRAGAGELGIVPGSMGARSYIVRGRGNAESWCSCSHGAGRRMSRGEAKRSFTLAQHRAATEGVECRQDEDVLDETPAAYKNIDAVMAAQRDLVDVVHTLKQVVCVKG